MIVICPTCGTRYRVEPEALGTDGRTVRCAGCGHRWLAAAEPPPAAPEPEARHEMAPPPALPSVAVPSAEAASGRSPLAWLVLALVTLMLTAAAVGRNDIAATFPQSVPVYRRLGLPVTLEIGLELRNVAVDHTGATDGALLVTGEIHNVTSGQRLVPPVRIGLLDAARHDLTSQLFDPPQRVLAAAGSIRFEARIAAPPAAAHDVAITFSDRP